MFSLPLQRDLIAPEALLNSIREQWRFVSN